MVHVHRALEDWKTKGRYQGPTLNRSRQELISLWRTLDGKQHDCPAKQIEKYPENLPRQGFFEREQYEAVLQHLPEHYADVIKFAYYSGWRKREILGLLWSEVDQDGSVIRLSPERAKSRKGRTLPIAGHIIDVIKRRAGRRGLLPFVFTRTLKESGRDVPVGDWRKAWKNACKAAGCPGMLLHDFRRTCIRNLSRKGVPQVVAMAWSGHKTDSTFRRYDIVSERDLHEAAARLLKGDDA